MHTLRIFVASSSEAISPVAEPVATALAQAGHQPLRWWQRFPAGDYPLESLASTLAESDAAVFVCTPDDSVRSRRKRSPVPRDNVIFELGYFIHKLGKDHCLLVKDRAVKLPSDLQGITYQEMIKDTPTVCSAVVRHFANLQARRRESLRQLLETGRGLIVTKADPRITELVVQPKLPVTWSQRALYCGTGGGRAWLAFSAEYYQNVLSDADARRERTELLYAIEGLEIDTYVSLGPGDAKKDYEIAIALRERNSELKYIPVDISDGLIFHACVELAGSVQIPFGIHTDFEQRMDFVESSLKDARRGPVLLSLLGGTFGNLDLYEKTFLSNAAHALHIGDHLLLDAGTRKGDWVFSADTTSNKFFESRLLRTFVGRGIARLLEESPDSIVSEFDQRISVRPGRSDVPGAQCYEIFDRRSGTVGLRVRRYEWKSLLQWIEKACPGFKVERSRMLAYENSDLGSGIVLLKRVAPAVLQ